MNYHGRVMELDIGWSSAELRGMAAEIAAEADAEIARLREALADALKLIETISPIEGETVRKIRAKLEPVQ